AVMEAVGAALLGRARRSAFGIAAFPGLFEAIGLPRVVAWLDRHGSEHLRWMARHFARPYLNEAGQPVVPPLTEWLFREHEDDNEAFAWFLMGHHSGKVWTESDADPARRRREMQPFLTHELRRVREWAEDEIRTAEEQSDFFREMA